MRPNRRQFLGAAAAAATLTIVPRHVLGGARHVAPSDKVNVALIGAGGQGRSVLRGLFEQSDVQVVAVADPSEHWDLDPFYYRGAAGRGPVRDEIESHYRDRTPNHRVSDYEDFRDLLENETALDAVVCATPDHLHAYVCAAVMRAGKHVYCEKPLTHNVREARLLAQIAHESGVATQMGNQGHSGDAIRETCELVWDGAIGPVREVHAWVGTSRWNPELTTRPAGTPPVPSGLNWDLWLGPRAERPFHPAYAPVAWRDFWDFGCGVLGDFGCHDLDAPCWALDLHAPQWVEGHPAGTMDDQIVPHGEICYYQFPARGDRPPVKITWYSGGLRPRRPDELPAGESLPDRGVMFVGDRGLLLHRMGPRPRLLPAELDESYTRPEPTLERSPGHHREWLDAVKGGPPAGSNFAYGARLTEITLLGVAAIRSRRRLEWDAERMTATNAPEVDAILRGSYRAGWEVS